MCACLACACSASSASQLKNRVLKGVLAQVMPYSTGLSTPLANFEANQNYKDTVDPSVMVGQSHPGLQICWCMDSTISGR